MGKDTDSAFEYGLDRYYMGNFYHFTKSPLPESRIKSHKKPDKQEICPSWLACDLFALDCRTEAHIID